MSKTAEEIKAEIEQLQLKLAELEETGEYENKPLMQGVLKNNLNAYYFGKLAVMHDLRNSVALTKKEFESLLDVTCIQKKGEVFYKWAEDAR